VTGRAALPSRCLASRRGPSVPTTSLAEGSGLSRQEVSRNPGPHLACAVKLGQSTCHGEPGCHPLSPSTLHGIQGMLLEPERRSLKTELQLNSSSSSRAPGSMPQQSTPPSADYLKWTSRATQSRYHGGHVCPSTRPSIHPSDRSPNGGACIAWPIHRVLCDVCDELVPESSPWARVSEYLLRATAEARAGISFHVRPSSSRRDFFFLVPPHCLKKKGTPGSRHWTRTY